MGRGVRDPLGGGLAALLLLATCAAAQAHPHVWIKARAELVYAPDGRVTALRHRWTFDESYTAFAVQGLAEGDALPPAAARELAKTNIESLAESGYFTVLRAGGAKQVFAAPPDGDVTLEGKQLTLRFTLPLVTPAAASRLMLDVVDPTFFVDFAFAEGDDAVRLDGAPAGCAVDVKRPKPKAPSESDVQSTGLSESLFGALSGAGGQFGNRTLVTCR